MHNVRQTYEELISSLQCNVTLDDYSKLKTKIETLKAFSDIEKRSISLYDIKKKQFILKVDNHIEMLGYSIKDFYVDDIQNYHSMIHHDDVDYLYDSEIKMYNFLKPIKTNAKKDYKLVYDYRVQAKDGSYMRFMHQLSLYELDKDYNSWILLIISDILSSYFDNAKPRRMLINTKNNEICLFNEELGIKKFLVSKREKEVIKLIEQGFDSVEIANILCISKSTVNNHRQHILEKTRSKNITQAVTYLRCIGI